MELKINNRPIGPGHTPYFIAEVGSNWRDLNDARHAIGQAKAAGADAVKFQAYDYVAMYGFSYRPMPGGLPLDWLWHLRAKADSTGTEFLCSAFSPELIDAVDPYVSAHKVASAEMTHIRMLEKLREIGKPVILSTGASGEADIAEALRILDKTPVILLYCVAAYPARAVDPRVIKLMAERFKCLVGFSDHSLDYTVIPKMAIDMGACMIEKHFTTIPEVDTPDRGHSLTPDQFRVMVNYCMGKIDPRIGYTGEEQDMITQHNRRLVATSDINAGETLVEGANFGIYRSLKEDVKGLSPFAISRVIGKTAARDIPAGDGIGPGDFV